MKKIVFVGANPLLEPLIEAASEVASVTVCEETRVTVPVTVDVRPLKKEFLGFDITGEVSLPLYQRGLNSVLKEVKPDTIIVMDFIRLWYWQVIWYRLWHKEVRVMVYVETQRVPRSFISEIVFYLFWFFYRLTERWVAFYVVYTNLGRQFAEAFGVKARVVMLPVPVDTDVFVPTEERTTSDSFRLLMNARYVPYKRHKDIFEALLLAKANGLPVQLTCIGRGGDQRAIREEIDRLGLSSLVTCLDPVVGQAAMVRVYQSHDALILPSDGEAIGMVVPEAMACGLPTITTTTVGANVYVQEGETGYVVPPKNPRAISEAIQKLADKDVQKRMSQAARARIEQFSLEQSKGPMKDFLVT